LSLLVLIALLLPLLAACGGAAQSKFTTINSGLAPGGDIPPVPAEAQRGSIAAAPTAAS
jgi:hypothetical protein